MKGNLPKITRSAVIAALYFLLTFFLQPIGYGPVQFRLSEALVMLPFVFAESWLGVGVGCLLVNVLSPFGIYDVVIGSLATFVAAFLTSKIKNVWLAGLPPVILNALLIPLIFAINGSSTLYILDSLLILLTEGAVVYLIGVPLVSLIKRRFLKSPKDT